MPFKGQMTFPCELTITKFNFGYKVIRNPVSEIELLHDKHYDWEDENLIPGLNKNLVKRVKCKCLHIIGEFDLKTSNSFGFMIRKDRKSPGTEVLYDVKRGTISVLGSTIPLMPVNKVLTLEILVDRASIEIFANGGRTVISSCFTPEEGADELELFTHGGELEVRKLDIYEVNSVWRE